MTSGEGLPKTSGLVWAPCLLPGLDLARALPREADVHVSRDPPEGESPSLVLVCPREEEVAAEVARVRGLAPGATVVVLGARKDVRLARAAFQAGARGFLPAGMSASEVARAVSVALGGEIVVPRGLLPGLIRGEEPADPSALNARQREILPLVAEGLTNAQIAKRLFLSESTVKQHLRAAYKHLGVKNRTEAARLFGGAQGARPEGIKGI